MLRSTAVGLLETGVHCGWEPSGRDPLQEAFGVTLIDTVQREIREAGDRLRCDVLEEIERLMGQDHISQDGGTGSPTATYKSPVLQKHASVTDTALRLAPSPAAPKSAADLRQNAGSRLTTDYCHPMPEEHRHVMVPLGSSPAILLKRYSADEQTELPGMVPVPEDAQSTLSMGFAQSGEGHIVRVESDASANSDAGLFDSDFVKRIAYADRVSMKLGRGKTGKTAPRSEARVDYGSSRKSRGHVDHRAELMINRHEKRRRSTYTAFAQAALYQKRRSTVSAVLEGVRNALRWFLESDFFDYTMGAVLLANAALMGYQANYYAEKKLSSLELGQETETPVAFHMLDIGFCIVFALELGCRLYINGKSFFCGDGWKWNVFDMFIIFSQVLDEFVKFAIMDSSVQGGFSNVGAIRILRLARLMRLIRMVRLIPELKSMVYLIYASIGSFVWSLMLILIMMYCYSIYYTEIVTDMVSEGLVSSEQMEQVNATWGSVPVSVFTLWMAISGGDDWHNFTDVLKKDNLYILHVCLFVMYIAFGTLVMLNLVTVRPSALRPPTRLDHPAGLPLAQGVFVESAQRIMKEDKDAELVAMASKIFLATDVDGSSEISYEEFSTQMEKGGMEEYIKAIGIGPDELSHLYELLDQDDSGTVNAGEFIRGCLRLRGPARALDLAEMEYQMRENFHTLAFAIARLGKLIVRQSPEGRLAASSEARPRSSTESRACCEKPPGRRIYGEEELV